MRVAAEARQNAELRLVWDTAGTDSARCAWCERWLWPLRSPPSSARALRATAVLGPIPSTIPSRSMSPDTVPAQSRRTAATSPTWFATLTRAGSTCSGPGGRTCRAECKPRKAPACHFPWSQSAQGIAISAQRCAMPRASRALGRQLEKALHGDSSSHKRWVSTTIHLHATERKR